MSKTFPTTSTMALCLGLATVSVAQLPGGRTNWSINPSEKKVFVENRGQFDGKSKDGAQVYYGVDNMGTEIYFSQNGLTYRFEKWEVKQEKERKNFRLLGLGKEEEEDIATYTSTVHSVGFNWLGANKNASVHCEEKTSEYFNYQLSDQRCINYVPAYKKLVYKDMYPGIDVVYTFHEKQGMKYMLIVHPGADVSKVKLAYGSDASKVSLDQEGNIHLKTAIGDIVDHAPVSYFEDGEAVSSAFSLQGNTVAFELALTSNQRSKIKDQKLIIDPWTVNPSMTTDNKVFDIEHDAAGNVFMFGGLGPYKLMKYTAGGTSIWTTSSTNTNQRYGDLAVTGWGTSYITAGHNGCNIVPSITKVSPAGVIQWNNTITSCMEFWGITSSCTGKVVVSDSFSPSGGRLSNIDTTNGNRIGSVQVTTGSLDFRAVCLGPNGNYYMITATGPSRTVGCSSTFATVFNVVSGHTSPYNQTTLYSNGPSPIIAGFNGIDASMRYVYHTDGAQIWKRDINTGAQVSNIPVPGGLKDANCGVAVDGCGNVYIGSQSTVLKYDSNLTLLTTTNTTGVVYDVTIGMSGEVLVCGFGFASSLNLGACPMAGSIVATATNTNATCIGNNGTATASGSGGTGAYTYVWSNGQTSQTASGLSAGTYTVTVSDGSGCNQNIATVNITGGGLNLATLSNNILCNGQSNGTASVTSSGGQGTYTYTWTNGQTTQTATGLSAGTYTVSVTDSAGCSKTQAFTITQPVALAVSDSSVNIQCSGNSTGTSTGLVIGGTGAYTYSWNNGQATQTATGLAAGTYTLTVTDANGCSRTHTVTITQPNGMSITGSGINILCNGQANGSATASVTGGSGLYTYSWNNGQTTQAATGLGAGTYTVVVTDNNGCTITQTVTVNQPSAIVVTATGGTICDGECINITANGSGGTGNITYTWNPGNLTGSSVNVCPNTTTTYTVTATDANGCTKTQAATVTVNPKPTASFTANPTTGQVPLNVIFTNTSTGGTTYSWIFGDGNSSSSQNSSNTYTNGGTYNPMLIVTNTFGCKDTFMLTIIADGFSEIIVPNVFSPNGDGYNEFFSITSIGLKDLYVEIYDRWGLKMGDFSALNGGWDGKAASGKDAPEGTYYYILLAHGIDSKEYNLKGYLLLLRK